MVITGNMTDVQLLDKIYSAAAEYEKLLGKDFLIVGKNKKTDYFWFECCFEKKNFMHLLGIHSRTMSATEFFNRCSLYNRGDGMGLTIKDCTPSRDHKRRAVNEKSSCCAELLRIQDARYMNVGKNEKIRQYVDFSYAYGNEAVLGFEKKANNRSCFPITLIPNSIDDFVNQKYKIIFIFEKKLVDEQYSTILMEIKEGIFPEHSQAFPEKLKKLITIESENQVI